MEISRTVDPTTRAAWRSWLAAHHGSIEHVWVLSKRPRPAGEPTYLDLVEEALCFGWVDGIAKRHEDRLAQRFTPRRPRSHWTELNKERARRLIARGLMTEAGHRKLPDLDPASWRLDPGVEAALRSTPGAWEAWQAFPPLYQRVRAGYVVEQRGNPAELARRLEALVARTARGELWGNWDDTGLPRTG